MKKPLVALLMFMILSPLIMSTVYAWDPSTSDLTGTNSSTNNSVSGANRRFDIDGSSSPTVYGMQKGDDSDSLALLMKMGTIQTSSPSSSSSSSTGPSTVGTSTGITATERAYQGKSFYANGRFWVFYYDGTIVYRTSTDGTTWSSSTTVRAGANEGRNFAVTFDGTYLHYAFCTGQSSGLYYRRGTPNSNGTITWSAAEVTVQSAVANRYRSMPSVAVDSNGYPWIGYSDDEGAATNYFPYMIKANAVDGSSWPASGTKLSTTDAETHVMPMPLTNGKVYAVYSETQNPVRGKLWDGSSWGRQETCTQYGTFWGGYSTPAAVAKGDDVYLVYLGANQDVRYNKRTYGTGWPSSDTQIQSSVTTSSFPAISINTANNDLYCFWAGYPTANHIYYKKYSGGSWDTNPTDWINEGTDTLPNNQGLTCFYQSYGNIIGLAYRTKAASPYNIKFAYLTLNSGFQVGTSTTIDSTQIALQRKSFYANGRYWVFYDDGSYLVYRTSTDGSSWSSATNVVSIGSGSAFSIWFDGTYLHYVYSGGYLYYRHGTPNSDGSITWSAAEQQVSTTYNQAWRPTISTDSNGYVWIGYADQWSTSYPFVIKSGNNDGTWGTTPSGFPYQLSSTPMPTVFPIW